MTFTGRTLPEVLAGDYELWLYRDHTRVDSAPVSAAAPRHGGTSEVGRVESCLLLTLWSPHPGGGAPPWRAVAPYAVLSVASIIPVLTIVGLQFGFLLGGTVVTETIFSRQGIGRLVVDDDLKVVGALVNLKWLSINNTEITDAALAHAADLPKLEVLNLDDTGVGDGALEHVGKITTLKRLHLNHTRVSNEGLKQLSELKNLEHLLVSE